MEFVLIWCFVFAYMAQRGAEGLVHAVKGTPNPRYELKKAKARAAGQAPKQEPRYGGKEWWADLYSDALAANTEKRRKKAAAKAQPIDDLADAVREPMPAQRREPVAWRYETPEPPVPPQPAPQPEEEKPEPAEPSRNVDREEAQRINAECEAEQLREAEWRRDMKPIGDYPKPTCLRCLKDPAQTGSVFCLPCDVARGYYSDGQPTPTPEPDTQPTARIYQFPNRNIEKEISMATNEVTGLSTAVNYADEVATTHESFNTEGYAGALARLGFGPNILALEAQAREASTIATAKWVALRDAMADFQAGREFYANNPDAPDKVALVNE